MKYSFCTFLDSQKRVDMYLSALFEDFSRSYIQKMVDRWQVKINGENIKKNVKVKNKDEIELEVILEKTSVEAEKMDLDIVYEDSDVLIINKDPWVNVHPVPWEGGHSGTLVNGVLEHCKHSLPSINGVERPWIVHRLDKDTSGLILIAKTDKMMSYLSDIIKERKIDKYYLAVVSWIVKEKHFKIESYLWRHPDDRTKMTSKNPVNGKYALTYGEVIDYIDEKHTLLKVKIETGRTHQIRVHLSSIGFPILGDTVYGNSKVNVEVRTLYQLRRQALHAYELEFDLYGEKRVYQAPIKDDFKKLLKDISF